MFEFLFYWTWRSFDFLPTYPLRDQTPCSSLPKMFLFLLVDFNFENVILKNKSERPQGHKIWKM